MLTSSENERLTRVGPGTPAGELLRRYWHPLCPAQDVANLQSARSISILGEDLVVFREGEGRYGLLEEKCPHRGASLTYGFVEDGGIRCPYHGWLFDRNGGCLEKPFEAKPNLQEMTTEAYLVEEHAGLLFGYLGPRDTATACPRWDILVRTDGRYRIDLQEDLECNWLQIQENAADVTHTYFLHSYMFASKGLPDPSGFNLPLKQYGFQPFEWGLVKSWIYEDVTGEEREGWGNLLVFPNILRLETEIHWRVPIDDYRTRIIILAFDPSDESRGDGREVDVAHRSRTTPQGDYLLGDFFSQDAMAWETQGRIYDRAREHLGASDVGVAMFRRMLEQQIDEVEKGRVPMATISKEAEGQQVDLRVWMGGYLPMSCPPDPTIKVRKSKQQVFDERHRTYGVPYGKARPRRDASKARD